MTAEQLAALQENIDFLSERVDRGELTRELARWLRLAIKLIRSDHTKLERGAALIAEIARYVRLMIGELANFREMAVPN
jgi:hypothetical protein